MALVSPGVEVTITDQSQYIPSAVGTVPYVLLVTAQDKLSGSGVGIAPGTLKANANKVYLVTSQQDLVSKFGTPTFYDNGNELNEYGLLAAYSAMGLTNRLYVQRADINLDNLIGSLVRPQGETLTSVYSLDVEKTTYGLTTWDITSQTFTYKKPIVITDPTQVYNGSNAVNNFKHAGAPLNTLGLPGDLAVVAVTDYQQNVTPGNNPQYAQNIIWQKVNPVFANPGNNNAPWYAGYLNTWQAIGSLGWQWTCAPTVVGEWIPKQTQPSDFLGSNYLVFINNLEYGTIDGTGVVDLQPGRWNSKLGSANKGVFATFQLSEDGNSTRLLIYANGLLPTLVPIDGVLTPVFRIAFQASDSAVLKALGIRQGNYILPTYVASPNYQQPQWEASRTTFGFIRNAPSGSIWQVTTDTQFNGISGAHTEMTLYNPLTKTSSTVNTPYWYSDDADAIYNLDASGGGLNIPLGTVYTQYSTTNWIYNEQFVNNNQLRTIASSTILYRYAQGPTVITGGVPTQAFQASFSTIPLSGSNAPLWMRATIPGSSQWQGGNSYGSSYTVPTPVFCPGTTLAAFVQGINDAAVPNVTAYIQDGKPVIVHATGGSIIFQPQRQISPDVCINLSIAGFTFSTPGVRPLGTSIFGNPSNTLYCVMSNWAAYPQFDYSLNQLTYTEPANNTLWYWNDPTQADIMIQNNGAWVGYRNCTNDTRGYNLSLTNATGPIFSTTAPTTQTNGNQLASGDLWIDTSDLENYPKLYRWTLQSFSSSWVLINNTDSQSSSGVLFADARWAPNATTNPATDPIPTISSLLISNYLDPDAPNPLLYPQGALLWNTRRSGYNVKSFQGNYFTTQNFPNSALPQQTSTWLTVSGNKSDGAPYMGRHAQRILIVRALKSGIDTTNDLRDEQKQFTLISCPQYPELAINMVALNNERGSTAFTLIDTPLRLSPDEIVTWATNNNGLGTVAADGLSISDTYSASWYPSCQATNLDGQVVVQPASHMMIRTIINSDDQSYPWFAPAGTQRGKVDNALQLGYLNSQTNEFRPLSVNQGIRDVLYTNNVNPLTFIPGSGIVNFGNKTSISLATALDRINVARLVAYLRGRLKLIADQYLFEPNDQITRNSISNVIDGLMIDLVAKRALYDYLIVCDLSNNTPDRIDRNELWVDIAVEPVKAVEFIYIPVRIKNTGAISSGQ